MRGYLDDVMIFNTSLNQANITAIYNNQSSRFRIPKDVLKGNVGGRIR